ncbi:hypothetical protein L210DRAFT_3507097 [Boletus edulis BED1]|uniref:Uncharacterized protein n=1 Tax=Boletus edulis BED1 TaxID=1328754 RepID=A0AAD4BKP9_BOLED|nr:hypothetical protein L210DRAFT_3507097 [Boletus edulis BED1]
MPKEPSNKHKRARDSSDASIQHCQPKGLGTGSAGLGARFKNPFSKGTVSTRNAMSTEIAKPYPDAATASFIPLDAIPPHPLQSYDSLLPKHQQSVGFRQATEHPEEPAHSPTPGIAVIKTNAPGFSDACLDPDIIKSDLITTSLVKANISQLHPDTGKQLKGIILMHPAPASRFSLTTSKRVAKPSNSTATNLQAAFPNGPKSIQSVSNGKAATIPKWLTDTITQLETEAQRLQEEVDNTHNMIQDQNSEIRMLCDEIATLHEAQDQNTKEVGDIHTGLQSLSSMVTEVVGKLETINMASLSLGDMKPVVTKPITEKKLHHGKQSGTGEVTFINKRDNTWNAVGVNASHEIKTLHPHSDGV